MEISVKVFDKICRTCLCQSPNMQPLLTKLKGDDRYLLEIVASVTNLDMKFEDTLPKQVCNECQASIFMADAFKRRCLESEAILLNVCEAGKDDCHLADLAKNKIIKSDIRNNIAQLSTNKLPNGTNSSIDEYFDRKDLVFSEFTACFTPDRNESINSEDIPLKDEADVKDIKLQLDDNLEAQRLFSNDFEMSVTEPDAHDDEGINNGLKPYICHCGLTFKSKDGCKRHMNKMTCDTLMKKKKLGTLLFRCPVCDEQLHTLSAWTAHHHSHDIKITNIKTEKQVTEYFCSLCNRKFKNKKSLRSHIQHHNKKSKITYKCEECKREFKYKAYLDNHILSLHTRDKGFPCQYCTKSFGTEESLNIHKEGHEIEKKHQCSICSKAFLMLCTLKDHMRTHTGEKPFLCSICGKGFSQKNNLAQHMRRHQGLKEFKCETCEKRFISKGELDAHERKHSGAHPFVCDDCNHGFTTSSSLVKHRRIHTGERPYACDLCPMRFAASGTLKNHRRTHTGEKPFQCSHCDKAFVQKSDLISHIRCHTGERPFICTQCGHAFRKAAALKAHVRMHGKDAHLGMQ